MKTGGLSNNQPFVRAANQEDLPFLRNMLYEAAYWRIGFTRPPIEDALATPELAKLLDRWGRDGDVALIALNEDRALLGATWYRFWNDADHSYGYVSETIPELGIGVVAAQRNRGVGTALLKALLREAATHGVVQISLSVERDNPAIRLYRKLGFREVDSVGNAWTMVADTSG